MQRRVHGDGYVAFALVEESLQLFLYAYRTDRDALGAPSKAPVGRHDFTDLQYGVQIVHGLTLSHKNNIGQAVDFG